MSRDDTTTSKTPNKKEKEEEESSSSPGQMDTSAEAATAATQSQAPRKQERTSENTQKNQADQKRSSSGKKGSSSEAGDRSRQSSRGRDSNSGRGGRRNTGPGGSSRGRGGRDHNSGPGVSVADFLIDGVLSPIDIQEKELQTFVRQRSRTTRKDLLEAAHIGLRMCDRARGLELKLKEVESQLDLYQSLHHQDKAALSAAQKLISHLEEQFSLITEENETIREQLAFQSSGAPTSKSSKRSATKATPTTTKGKQ